MTTKLFNILKNVELQECCKNHCRDWRETLGGTISASNHSPMCPNYKTETFFRVFAKGEKAPSCIIEKKEAIFFPKEEYDIVEVALTRDQFERLEEFGGF